MNKTLIAITSLLVVGAAPLAQAQMAPTGPYGSAYGSPYYGGQGPAPGNGGPGYGGPGTAGPGYGGPGTAGPGYGGPGTAGPGYAGRGYGGPGYGAPQQTGPQEVVQQGLDKIKTFIGSKGNIPAPQIMAFLRSEISPYFDFDNMTQMILGPMTQQFSPQQRAVARKAVERMFLSALAGNLSKYRGGSIDRMQVSGNLEQGQVRLRLRIVQQSQYPVALELRISRGAAGWKIYDVAANGISAVAHYRNYMQSLIQREGIEAAFAKLMQ